MATQDGGESGGKRVLIVCYENEKTFFYDFSKNNRANISRK
ncbi:MAG: type II toxin-antitoxin system RelE/ParE family toxin [Ectothiorhodospiraceae bacterium]|nr:type II toxin-antitoxin system RelE/ParE family toxin [Ectothiorhodospiraceae bacterium]